MDTYALPRFFNLKRKLRKAIEAIRDQWARLPDLAKDLTGKTVIVVGANVGLGFEGFCFPLLRMHGRV